jgi:mannose-6-phosphate isomerase-like protein (cupin superfamily)
MEPISVVDSPEREVTIRLALDDVVITQSRYAPGQRGPDLHVHRLHTDCFYVLEGELTLALRDREHVVGPGTFVLVPPHVVHAFRHDGTSDVHFLNLHAPGMGFDRYVQEIGGTGEAFSAQLAARYDQHPPPDDGGRDPETVIVRTAQSDTVSLGNTRIAFLANADETLDAIGLIEYTAPPGFPGPPPHFHDRAWDVFYVLEGRLALRHGDEQLELGPGELAAIPPGTAHGFANPYDVPARFLDVHSPGGFEQYFRDVAAAIGDGPPDPEVMGRIASRFDVRPAQ